MKVEITNPHEKKFKPITMKITIETREELLDMWARHASRNEEVVRLVKDVNYGNNSSVVSAVGKPALVSACNSIPPCALDVPLLVALKKLILG